MAQKKTIPKPDPKALEADLQTLKLRFCLTEYPSLAKQAAEQQWPHEQYLEALMQGEALALKDRQLKRRLQQAKLPFIKTLEQFDWTWPAEINELQIKHLFRLNFIKDQVNVIFMGGVGLGKSHLSTALGHQACLKGYTALFASAVEIINNLSAAQQSGRLKQELRRYQRPDVLIVDELGYLPVDKRGADLLFQVISERYEQGSIIVTTNKAFSEWAEIFNGDSTLTSAVLDRLLHHSETAIIKGKSYRMKDRMD